MSSVFSKNKEKRPRSSTSESNNSFVKNVTSRVSGLLPATITKWFSSPSSSANGSAPAAEGSDSSTEDEGPDSPAFMQPPSKRVRYSAPENQFTSSETPPSPIEAVESQDPLYESIQSPTGRSSFRKESSVLRPAYITPEDISRIEVVKLPRNDREVFKIPHTVTNSSPSVAIKRKSIFESTGTVKDNLGSKPYEKSPAKVSTPSFKPAYFGSPFYPGRTMYGGASSSSFIDHPNTKQRKMANVRQAHKDNEMVNISYSARRVMDLLENYSSPLSEAKRIPHTARRSDISALSNSSPSAHRGYSYKRQELYIPSIASIMQVKQRSRLMDTTRVARQIIASHSSTLSSNFAPYEDIPNSSYRRNCEKESTTKMKTNLTRPNRDKDSLDLPEPVQLPTAVLQIDKDNLPKFSLSGLTTHATSKPAVSTSQETKSLDSFSSSSPAFPPTNTSMSQPIFTFSSMTSQSSLDSDKNRIEPLISWSNHKITAIETKETSTPTPEVSGDIFKFSSPVAVATDSQETTTTPPKYTFGSPEQMDEEGPPKTSLPVALNIVEKSETTTQKPSQTQKPLLMQKPLPIPKNSPNDWKCSECWITNKDDVDKCASCTTRRPSKGGSGPSKAKCSMCKLADSQSDTDKCVNCEKIQMSKSIALPIPKPADPTKWKCEDCWVSNDGDSDKCACCGSRNPKKPAPAPVQPANVADSDWKCQDCWITNKSSVEKCAACGGVKPGTKTNAVPAPQPTYTSPFAKPPDEKLAEISKAQKEKWECPSCLVRNEPNISLCICCGMERPGPTTKGQLSKTTFSFGTVGNTTFKFGIDPKVQESKIEHKKEEVTKKEPTRKLEEPETNNNTVPKMPFSFSSKPDVKLDEAKKVETTKMTFSFGIPKQNTQTDSAPTFGTKTSIPTPTQAAPAPTPTPVEEKPQEVPTVDLNTSAQPVAQPFAGYFSSSQTTAQDVPKPFLPFTPSKALSNEKTETAHFSFGTTNASTATSQQTQNSFSFNSAAEINPVPMFDNQETSARSTSSISFGMPQAAVTTTTAPTMLFQKPAFNNEPSLSSMFQANETTPSSTMFNETSAPNPTPAPASTLFSFGTNSQSQPVEKPKFNFSFGSTTTNTDTFTSFKPVFGQPDNISGSGPFNMPVNNLPPGNGIDDNAMGGNGMSNPMTGTDQIADSGMQSNSQPMFGAPTQSENLWAASNSGNLFGNTSQKPAPFTFGSSNPFNVGQQQPQPQLFGNQNPQPAPSMFGNGAMFSSTVPNQPAPSLFGNSGQTGLFGANNSQPMPVFEPISQPQPQPQPQPAFNFGSQPSAGVFGFGAQAQQQPQLQQQQQPGVYNFGGGMNSGMGGGMAMGAGGTGATGMGISMGGVQFNMGSAPATNVRRMRKAMRRNPQR